MTIIDAVTDELCMWTIFHNTREAPGKYVARLFVGERATPTAFFCDTLNETRAILTRLYPDLICFQRSQCDAPQIVETWL